MLEELVDCNCWSELRSDAMTGLGRRLFGSELSWGSWLAHLLIVVFGTFAMVISTYYTLRDILNGH
jgi:hypothetical protein